MSDTCPTRLGDRTGLTCTRPVGHADGCVFISSWAPDRHDTSEAVQE